MELQKALSQLSDIHAQVVRSEVFRGYRAVTVLGTGAIALTGAAVQATLVPATDLIGFVLYWVLVACVCAGISVADMVLNTQQFTDRGRRRRSMMVVSQSLPALMVGALVTGLLMYLDRDLGALLPGLWALVFSLSLFAARPYLPRAIGWVGAFYVIAGIWMLTQARPGIVPSPWGMGLTFGAGQVALAAVFHRNIERVGDSADEDEIEDDGVEEET